MITISDLATFKRDMKCAQLRYGNEQEFAAIANTLRIMNDFKVRENSDLVRLFSNTYISSSVRFLQKRFSTKER